MLARRLSPYLDVAIGLAAAVMSVASLLSTDVAGIDPGSSPPIRCPWPPPWWRVCPWSGGAVGQWLRSPSSSRAVSS